MGEEDTRERLLAIAAGQFSSRGFRATSIRDIAAAGGMSVSSLYHHFGSKEGVLVAVYRHATELLVRDLRGATEGSLPPAARLRLLLESHLRFLVDRPDQAAVYVLDVEELSDEAAEVSRRAQREVLGIYLQALGELQRGGYLAGRNLRAVAFNIFGVLNWFLRWHRPGGALGAAEVSREVAGFVQYGLIGRST